MYRSRKALREGFLLPTSSEGKIRKEVQGNSFILQSKSETKGKNSSRCEEVQMPGVHRATAEKRGEGATGLRQRKKKKLINTCREWST